MPLNSIWETALLAKSVGALGVQVQPGCSSRMLLNLYAKSS